MNLIDTGVRLQLKPEPVALRLLRSRPDDFRQPEDRHQKLAVETNRHIDVLTERLAVQLQALQAAQAATTL